MFPRVSREQALHRSFWGNDADSSEVVARAGQDEIRQTLKVIGFDQLNEHIELLRARDIVGRAVMTF